MADPLQQTQVQGGSPAVAPQGVNGLGGGMMPSGAAPAAPTPPQSFAATFDELSGISGGSAEPGSATYQPPAVPQQPTQQQPFQQPMQPAAPPAGVAGPPQQPSQLPPGATTQPTRDIVQGMRSRGYQVPDDWNDDLLLGELGTLVESLQGAPTPEELDKYRQIAPQLYDFAQKRPEFEQWLAQQQQAGGSGGAQQQQSTAPQSPQVDPFADHLVEIGEVTRDAKGFYITQRPELGAYAQQLNARESHRQRFRAEFESDPQSFIQKFVDPVLSEKVKPYEEKIKELETYISQQTQQSATRQIEDYFAKNHSRFWQSDATGNQVFGPDGAPMMTPAGMAYANTVQSLTATIKDPLQRHNTAISLVDQVLAVAPPAAAGVQQAYSQQSYAQPAVAAAAQQFQQPMQQPMQQQYQQPVQQYQQPLTQQQRNTNFLQRNRIDHQLNGGRLPAAGYPNVLPQGNETPEGANSFEYLFDQTEALQS